MKRLTIFIVLVFLLAGCATTGPPVQEQWDKLTPDQQARLIIEATQDELESLWDSAILYKRLKGGSFDQTFESTVRPAFKLAWTTFDTIADTMERTIKAGGRVDVYALQRDVRKFMFDLTFFLIQQKVIS